MKHKIIVAIGGGENGRRLEDGAFAPYNTKEIDEEIVKLSNKENPNFLFINHAMESLDIQESYFQTMKKIYGDKLNCNCIDLKSNELTDLSKAKEKISWADIIYEGGGDTEYMINLWKETGFDKLLYDGWNEGKIISGISAGAICWFESGNSDSKSNFTSLDCLNWYNYYVTPHANEVGRIESTKKHLKEKNTIGILLSNCCALEIIDDNYKILKSEEDAYALQAYWKNDKYYQKEIKENGKLSNLDINDRENEKKD